MSINDLNVAAIGISASAPAVTSSATSQANSTAGTGKAAGTTAATTATLLNAVYTTTVGGKRYSGSISHADGLYTISVPNVPGASVTAPSLQAAEAELYIRIDELV